MYDSDGKGREVVPEYTSQCSIDGCDKPIRSGDKMCRMHEARVRRHGDPMANYGDEKVEDNLEALIDSIIQDIIGLRRETRLILEDLEARYYVGGEQ